MDFLRSNKKMKISVMQMMMLLKYFFHKNYVIKNSVTIMKPEFEPHYGRFDHLIIYQPVEDDLSV